jgi:precorrin-3B C17-methyltransferase
MGKLYVVGIGPGSDDGMTIQAQTVLKNCDVIVGDTRYMKPIKQYTQDKEVYQTGMHGEVERCKKAVEIASGEKKVAVVSSGDSGVYGMAGLVLEIVEKDGYNQTVDVEIIPGMTSGNSCAALLGAPLMHDYVTLSLSDWLTDMELIEKRLHCVGQGNFIVAIYNPKSKARPEIINKAQEILLQYKTPDTPVGIVKNAYRDGQSVEITTLKDMLNCDIDMLTTIIVGNSSTYVADGKMITPRGYKV